MKHDKSIKISTHKKKWLGWGLYILFLLSVSEIALRVYLVHFADAEQFDLLASRSMLENRFGKPRIIPHTFLGYQNNPSYQYKENQHNSAGFRGEEIVKPKPESTIRIVCMGGSTTYCSGVQDYKMSYPFLLNKALKEQGIDTEVINAGVTGYNSLQTCLNYQLKVETLDPDILIIYHGINDMKTRIVWPPSAYTPDQSGTLEAAKESEHTFLKTLSITRVPLVLTGFLKPDIALESILKTPKTAYFYELKSQLYHQNYPNGIFKSIPLDSMIQTNQPIFFRNNIERLILLAQAKGTQVVLSTFVFSDQFPEYTTELQLAVYRAGIEEHSAVIRELSMKHNLPLVDFEKELVIEKELFTDGMHFSKLGNERRLSVIMDHLVPLISENERGSF